MKVKYLGHSGYGVFVGDMLLVFDYISHGQKGQLTGEDISSVKMAYVFASHSHGDHYSRDIKVIEEYVPTTYLMDAGIKGFDGKKQIALQKGDVFDDENIHVIACGSTDIGISFLAQTSSVNLFHAGDLNCWHWQGEADEEYMAKARADFEEELAYVKSKARGNIDLAFFPVDPRMEGEYYEGARRFIEELLPKNFFAMHFWDKYWVQGKLRMDLYKKTCLRRIFEKGQVIDL